jgi:hypothetical protein
MTLLKYHSPDLTNSYPPAEIFQIRCMEEIQATAGDNIAEIFTRTERITGLAVLTLIYLTIEPDIAAGTVLSSQCISVALRALSEHQECMRLLEHTEHNMVEFYVQWSVVPVSPLNKAYSGYPGLCCQHHLWHILSFSVWPSKHHRLFI